MRRLIGVIWPDGNTTLNFNRPLLRDEGKMENRRRAILVVLAR
jgi:hypothetical protein